MAEFKNEYEYLIHLVKCAMRDLQPEEMPENFSFKRFLSSERPTKFQILRTLQFKSFKTSPMPTPLKTGKPFMPFLSHEMQINLK